MLHRENSRRAGLAALAHGAKPIEGNSKCERQDTELCAQSYAGPVVRDVADATAWTLSGPRKTPAHRE
jgi:hypothetical protein